MTATRITAPDGSLWQLVPVEVVKFLNGEGPLEGRWFGDDPPVEPTGVVRRYWWRKHLDAAAPEFGGVAVDLNGWLQGAPSGFRAEEWFIAQTTYGGRVVLRALPKGHSYDFKTADETYIARDKIAKWMPFPDSEFTPPAADEAMGRDTLIAAAAKVTGIALRGENGNLDVAIDELDAAMRGGESGE